MHVLYAPPTLTCCTIFASRGFSVACRIMMMMMSHQSGTHLLLAFVLVRHHTHSIVFLKPAVLNRPSVPSNGSQKCLRFDLWLTMSTIRYFIYLLIYLLSAEYVEICREEYLTEQTFQAETIHLRELSTRQFLSPASEIVLH